MTPPGTTTVSPPDRLLRIGLALAMGLALFVGATPKADAHAGCLPEVTTDSLVQSVVSAVNVFSSVFSTTAQANCVDKFADVEPIMERDYVATDRAPAATGNAKALANSNRPTTFANCKRGMAAGMFPCDNVAMLSHVTMEELGSVFINDMWGWTDPVTGQDFALVGGSEGVFFIDISDPFRPLVQGILPTHTTAGGDFWRDIKVFDDHAFVVSENSGHGVQVMDLSVLRDWDGERTTYTADARYTGVGSVHNIAINEATGYAYAVGSGGTAAGITCGSGLHMIDVNDPLNPTYAGCFQDHGYVHDTNCVVYDGPDADYQGHEICFNSTPSGAETVSIVDVTDKANPVAIAREPYDVNAYSHQGWLSPDQGTFFHGDELDESGGDVEQTTTRVWDMTDLDAPILAEVFANDTTSIDHNMYTEGERMYQANYTTGLRVMDIDDAAEDGLREVAFFDLYPENDNPSFEGGAWSNYPYFSRPNIVGVSSIDRGFFVLRVSPAAGRGRN